MIFKFGRKIDLKINWSVKKPHGHKGVARSSVVMGFCRHSSHPHPVQTFLVLKGFSEKKIQTVIYCRILKRFCLQWKAFDFLNKMRYIFWVLTLLEACDITNNGRHLGFYQELEIRLKPREMVIFCVIHEK